MRKRGQRSSLAVPDEAKENGTPASVRRSARLAFASPGPQAGSPSPAATETTPTRIASPRAPGGSSSRPSRGSTPRKAALEAEAGTPTAARTIPAVQDGSAAADVPADAEPSVEHPIGTPVASTSQSYRPSPFPAFSPSTPAIRTHDSYSDTELTDCDADGSLWEDDYAEPSFAYPADEREAHVVAALERLRVEDTPQKATDSQEAAMESEPAEDSVVLTATEVESSGSEADADDSLELGPIQEDDEDSEGSATAPSSEAECDALEEQDVAQEEADEADLSAVEEEAAALEAPALTGEEEDCDASVPAPSSAAACDAPEAQDEAVVDDVSPVMEDEVAPQEALVVDGEDATVQGDVDVQEHEAEPAARRIEDAGVDALDVASAAEETSIPAQECEESLPRQSAVTESPAAAAPISSSSALSTIELSPASGADHEPSSAETSPVESDEGAEQETAEPESDAATPAAIASASLHAGEEPVDAAAELAQGTPQRSSAQVERPESPARASVAPEPIEASSPPPLSSSVELSVPLSTTPTRPPLSALPPPSATPAATPPSRSGSVSALNSSLPLGNAAPTARRQLTKLTSGASQRSVASTKSTLTALGSGSTASSSRNLPVPSRLAGVKRPEVKSGITSRTSEQDSSTTGLPAHTAQAPTRQPRTTASSAPLRRSTQSTLSSSTSSNQGVAKVSDAADKPGQASTHPTQRIGLDRSRSAAANERAAPSTRRTVTSTLQPPTGTGRIASRPRAAAAAAAAGPTQSGATSRAPLIKTPSLPAVAAAPASKLSRAPRAAQAVRPTASAPSLSASAPARSSVERGAGPAVASRSSAKPVSLCFAFAYVLTWLTHLFAQQTASTGSAAPAAGPARPLASASARSTIPDVAPPTLGVPSSVSRTPRSPARPAAIFASPPRGVLPPARGSPLRSPRRVPLSQQHQSSLETSAQTASILVAPAPVAVAAAPAVFGSTARPVQPRMTRTTRRTAQVENAQPASNVPPAPVAASTRPARAAAARAAAPASAVSTAPGPPPGGRMARKLTRKPPTVDLETISPAEETSPDETKPTVSPAEKEDPPAAPSRPPVSLRPAPVLTQDELNRLTQRNTKKNQQTFNQLKIETVFLDHDRPPSPTSKIRKSSALANAASKEGREARAAKRRNALRASVDGSELETFSKELAGDAGSAEKEHFRAPGDEEPYITPARRGGALKSSGSSERAVLKKKKRSSAEAELDGQTTKSERRVRWDRALVYYDAKPDTQAKPSEAGILVTKVSWPCRARKWDTADSPVPMQPTDIDAWGNPTSPADHIGKAVPVTILMRVFKNDDKS